VAAVCIVAGYLLGSIPSGVLFARLAGVDPRRGGSGNIGATNVARLAGLRLGLLTLAADMGKGATAVLLARAAGQQAGVAAGAGLAALLGHLFPLALGFRGGKGVATALGVLTVLAPFAALAAAGTFVVALLAGRWVSVASLAGAAVAPVAVALSGRPPADVAVAIAMSALVLLRHTDNLRRLAHGTEPRV
jgi:glycerol-3-phosphate acyltransferase PlsY